MFFAFHILILITLQISNTNSFPINKEIYPDGKDPRENENFLKSKDDLSSTASSFAAYNSLLQVFKNISLITQSTTQNSKPYLFDKMFSEEMIAIKQLIYDKEKPKLPTPSIVIRQKWPVLELMSKLSKNNNAVDYKDESDGDFLGNFIFNDSVNIHRELENLNSVQATITDNKAEKIKQTVKATLAHTSGTHTYTNEIKDGLLHFQLKKSVRDQRTILKEDYDLDDINNIRKKNIELRSLNHHREESQKANLRNVNKACTCKKIPGFNNDYSRSISVKCTASKFYDANKQADLKRSTPCCTASNHQENCGISTTTPITLNCPQETKSASCPPRNPATTCFPISTTTYYTTCYTIYPSTVFPVNYQNTYQPYFYQPYQLFMQAEKDVPQKEKKYKYKPPNKHTAKRYTEDRHDLYYDYDMENYDDFLDNNRVEAGTTFKKDCKQVILQENGCRKDKSCTRGVDDTDRNKFVDEVVTDLKKIYGNSVLKDCYCGLTSAGCAFIYSVPLMAFICVILNLQSFYL